MFKGGSLEEIEDEEGLDGLKKGLVKGFNTPEGLCLTSNGCKGQDTEFESREEEVDNTVSMLGSVAGLEEEEEDLNTVGGGEGGIEAAGDCHGGEDVETSSEGVWGSNRAALCRFRCASF